MVLTDMKNTRLSDLDSYIDDYSVDSVSTDGPADQKETIYINQDWAEYLGYYKQIPELKRAIDAKATWTIGKGYEADDDTKEILDNIRGFGKDSFNTILENMLRTMYIGGDSFAEIIRDEEGELINLKPLDPSSIRIIADRNGIIKRYEQFFKTENGEQVIKFKPLEIFHLARNRVADEIHGQSLIRELKNIILMRNEAMQDWKRVLHRNVEPLWIFHLDTDDTTTIETLKNKYNNARKDGENMFIPKDAVVPELVSVAQNANLNPLNWIDSLNNYFYEACGTPKIIVGGAQEFTEASAKIAYLAFEQTIEEDQLFIEEQVGLQLGVMIELNFPASLKNELLSDESKDGNNAFQQNDTTAGIGQ